MSIVLAMSTDDRVIVKSDGREMNNGKIVNEDICKHDKITHNCIIGYTGVKYACIEMVKFIKSKLNFNDTVDAEKVILQVQKEAVSNIDKYSECAFIVAGFSKRLNKPIICGVSYTDKFSTIRLSYNDNKQYGYLAIGAVNNKLCEFLFDDTQTIEDNMDNYIKTISKLNHTVNDHISTNKLTIIHSPNENKILPSGI